MNADTVPVSISPTSWTHPAQKTYTIKVRGDGSKFGWACSCRHRLGGMTRGKAVSSADAHAGWHSLRHDATVIEAGGV